MPPATCCCFCTRIVRSNRAHSAAAEACLGRCGVVAGCFRMTVTAQGPAYRLLDACATVRVRLTGLIYGDQGLFVERRRFERIGGFPPLMLMEEVFLSRTLRRQGRIVVAPGAFLCRRDAGSDRVSCDRRSATGALPPWPRPAFIPIAWRRIIRRYDEARPRAVYNGQWARGTRMILPTLMRQNHPLADPSEQLRLLDEGGQPTFAMTLARSGRAPLRAAGIQVLQVNVGKLCNQTCRHCHVDAGPERREIMSRETMALCLNALVRADIPILDITGGAPEMNPHFRWLVAEARGLGRHAIDRCNLTILLTRGHEDLPEFLAEHRVEIVASLPCYLAENTDKQRGQGVFDKSIVALRRLNALGYGKADSGLVLTLVHNPLGTGLPPPQPALEADYRRELAHRYGVVFTRLFALANLPISRFLEDLAGKGRHTEYLAKLTAAYNPEAADGVMCRTTLSVGWDGWLYDCDFNQMLELELAPGLPRHIRDFDEAALSRRSIVTAPHCYGCTAGSGSGCQGAIVNAL